MGNISLLQVCKEGHIDLVQKFLSSPSCNLLACDEDGNTALHLAAEQGHLAVVQELAGRYTTPSASMNTKGRTPLHLASMRGHSAVVETLAWWFPEDLKARDGYGDTPLHLAALFGHVEIVDLLCQQFHCDPSVKGHDDCTLLHDACAGGHLDLVRCLIIDHGLDPLAEDVRGDTPLHYAAWDGHSNVLVTLISEFNCSPHVRSSNGTLLLMAAGGGHWQLVQKLISEYGLDPTHRDNEGWTAIHWALGSDFLDYVSEFRYGSKISYRSGDSSLIVVEKLVSEYGCDVNVRDNDGHTPLHVACNGGHLNVVEKLVSEYGCDVNVRDNDGYTPLHIACNGGHLNVVEKLVSEYGCDVNVRDNDGYTPLYDACNGGHLNVVEKLVSEYGCDVNVRDNDGYTPLHDACNGGHLNVVKKLVSEYSCDTNARDSDGCTPLHVAALAGREEVVRELIAKYKCPMNSVDSDGNTPLHCAASKGHVGVVRMLVSKFGADVAVCISTGNTALNLAAINGHAEVVNLLISEFGCSPSVKGFNGQTPLHQACDGGQLNVVKKLVSEYSCDMNARDSDGCTPLHVAALAGREEVVRELIAKYKCPMDSVDSDGNTPLHCAASKGHVGVVRMLVSKFGADVAVCISNGDTALNLAASHGHAEVVSVLVSEFGCSPSVKGRYQRTPLHDACGGGHLNVVEKLLSTYGCDMDSRDYVHRTPLHIAARHGRKKVVRELIIKYKCPVDCVDSNGLAPLHWAAIYGHVGVVRMLVSEFGAAVTVCSSNGNTALNQAAIYGHAEVVGVLISEFGCSPSVKGQYGRTPLHDACEGGHLDVVEKLVSEYGCDVMARDNNGRTPLHVAAQAGRKEVVIELESAISKGYAQFHKPTMMAHSKMLLKNVLGSSYAGIPLNPRAMLQHIMERALNYNPNVTVRGGQIPSSALVRKVRSNCAVNARDNDGLTPLHVAAQAGRQEVVRALTTMLKCPVNCVDYTGYTPLHWAAEKGHVSVVRMLLSELRADKAAHIKNGNTALHLAAFNGHVNIVDVLISEFDFSPVVKGQYGRTPLHFACSGGHLGVVERLVSEYGCDVNARDNDGLTPLYFAIHNHHSAIVAELVRHNSDLKHVDAKHKKLLKSAKKRSKQVRTRAFVIGAPEVGKSTLVEALKSENIFTWNVKDQVLPHTAGIVPVFHESSDYGWVVFYDFAGDEEYYSSHAAILERIMSGSSNIFLLVFDLNNAAYSIYYWLRFLTYACDNQQTRLQVLLIGSHADVLQEEGRDADKILSEIFTIISKSFYAEFPETSVEMFGYVSLNCRLTKSPGLKRIKAQLKQFQLSSQSDAQALTGGASILLGTLVKDFQGKVACQVKDIIEHIKSHELYIPPEAEQLHSYLKELHDYGSILVLDCSSPREDEWIVLNLPMFLSTVPRRLFCHSYHEDKDSILSASLHRYEETISNLGIIPTTRLKTMFPEFSLTFLKGCLTLLQYCHEICDTQIISKVLEVHAVETIPNESVLFFPALLKLQTTREKVKLNCSHDSLRCIGWYAECFRTYDFFPPRFLHVLLLRLAFTFALPHNDDDIVDAYSRKCTLWKNGIHWLMKSGVEAVVEVVKQKRAVLVMVRGSSDQQVECGEILSKVVAKVVEAKSEFCNSLKAKAYIVSPDDLKQSTIPEAHQLKVFEVRDIQEVLLKGSEGAVSKDGMRHLHASDLVCLQTLTSWNQLFPMGIKDLMHYLKDIVIRWYELGVQLDVPLNKLNEIRCNNSSDVYQCKLSMLQAWQRQPTLKPSWCTLVDALRKMEENVIAEKIAQQFNVDFERKLLDTSHASCELDEDTLQQLADTIGDKWASIAPLLFFTTVEIEQIRKEEHPAQSLLQKLKDNGTLTHEQLCSQLRTISLLRPTI